MVKKIDNLALQNGRNEQNFLHPFKLTNLYYMYSKKYNDDEHYGPENFSFPRHRRRLLNPQYAQYYQQIGAPENYLFISCTNDASHA